MSNNEIVKVNPNNSLVKANNLISLTSKLLSLTKENKIVLYNLQEYNLQRNIEIAFTNFIIKNIWLFLPRIINQIKNDNLSCEPYPPGFILTIEKHDLNYEYPRTFFRKRGSGTSLVDSEYDKKKKEKNEKFIWCSPPVDKEFERLIFQNITCFIAGKIITEYTDTSLGVAIGVKYKWTQNE